MIRDAFCSAALFIISIMEELEQISFHLQVKQSENKPVIPEPGSNQGPNYDSVVDRVLYHRAS